ncbi:MAG: DUF1670 domain-containing protein [Victivallaceae bacterium]|jgi:hypothetical protein
MKQTQRQTPAWERKTLEGILGYFLEQNCLQLGGRLMIEPVVKEVIRLFDEFCPPIDRLKMGQVVWYAVDVNEKSGYGKSIDKCKLNAVVLDLINLGDIDDLLAGLNKRERQKKVAARLFEQAYEQGSVLTSSDVAAIMRLAPARSANTSVKPKRSTGSQFRVGGTFTTWDQLSLIKGLYASNV